MRSIALVAAVVVALVCANGALAAPTRSEFIRKGDVLCTQTARELVPIRRRAQTAKTLPLSQQWAAAADIWADQIAIQRRFVSHFRALGTPASDRPAQRLVAGLARGVTLAVRVQEGFAERDVSALSTALPAYIQFTLGLNKSVVAYGFRACGHTT